MAAHLMQAERPMVRRATKAEATPLMDVGTFGLGLYLAGMSLAFVAAAIAFVVVVERGATRPVDLPIWFWLSTLLILISSATLSLMQAGDRMGRLRHVEIGVLGTLALGGGFLISQGVGFYQLVTAHAADPATDRGIHYLIVFLGLLHALHLSGGLIRLGGIAWLARHQRVRPTERHMKQIGIYWHYLTGMWLVMFGLFIWAHGLGPPAM